MPLYDYKCDNCNSEFEVFGKPNELQVICPFCNSLTKHRLISKFGKIENFDPHFETDIDDKPVFVRHRQDLKDAIAKFNDGEQASKTGKLTLYDDIF